MEGYRYSALNPARTDRLEAPCRYRGSSEQINALGKKSALYLPPGLDLALAEDEPDQKADRDLFNFPIEGKLTEEPRQSVNQGIAVGSDSFKQPIEFLTGRQMTERKEVDRLAGERLRLDPMLFSLI